MWTVGHSTRSLTELIVLLRAHGVTRVADVRRFPRSRRHPQFDAAVLARDLPAAGVAYLHYPGLGGFRRPRPDSPNTGWRNAGFRGYADYMQTVEFAQHLDALLAATGTASTALMCAESVPRRCHRALLADALVVRGVAVHHIVGPGRPELHSLTPPARVDNGRLTYPGPPDLFPTG